MPATKFPTVAPYVPRGTMRVVVLDAAPAAALAPTRSELNAGDDIADEIAALSGWSFATTFIEVPRLGQFVIGSIPGSSKGADSSFVTYRNKAGAGAHTLFTTLTTYYIVFLPGGDVAASNGIVYPVTCGANNPLPTLGDEPMRQQIDFGMFSEPNFSYVVPA